MARRRKKKETRLEIWYKLLVLIAFVFAVAVVSIVSVASSGQFDIVIFAITFAVTLLVFIIGLAVLSSPSVKGRIGEARVHRRLKKLEKRCGGKVFHNIMVEGENGKTSQIDHIYVCKNGVFVIETKNYAGRVYGKDDQQQWTQVLAYGKVKNKLYNPVKQNWTHIYRLKEVLGEKAEIENIVVFVQGNVRYIESEYVYTLRDLKHLLSDFPDSVANEEEVSLYCSKIQALIDNPVKTDKAHVQEIKKTQKQIKAGVCPRCGAPLVERTAKSTGKKFLGCSRYPECRFTKEIDS